MNLTKQISSALLLIVLFLANIPVFAVDDYYQQQQQYQQMLKRQRKLQKGLEHDRYRRQVGEKAVYGVANIVSAPLEIPKNIINVTNEEGSNIFYGIFGGIIRGSIDGAARISNGIADLVTAPIPTQKVPYPRYVWDDFDQYNTYGPVMRLVDNPPIELPAPPAPRPVVKQPSESDSSAHYRYDTNKKLDTMFRQEMMK